MFSFDLLRIGFQTFFAIFVSMRCQSNFGCVAMLITMGRIALTVIYPIMVSCVFRPCLQRSLYLYFFLYCFTFLLSLFYLIV